jgi:ABC-2 type transport system ATP-binding protein
VADPVEIAKESQARSEEAGGSQARPEEAGESRARSEEAGGSQARPEEAGGSQARPEEAKEGRRAQPEVVVRLEGLGKTFVTGFIPLGALARRGGEGVRPELDPKVLPRAVEAVKGLDLEVRRGEIFGLLGPNGSGKTTTIKMMMGLIFPSRGSISVLGRPVGDLEAKRLLGYLPENPTFYDYLRADEFLDLAARLCGVGRAERRRRIPALLEQVGLSEALNRPLRKFSKGMLQRIGLAQTLVHDPALVVLDEPMSGLDPIGRKEVRDLIFGLRSQGKTVLFSTHILSDVEMICDRVGILVKGELRDVGPLDALLSARTLETEVTLEGDAPGALALARERGWTVWEKGGRLQIRLPGDGDPRPLLSAALEGGAKVVSVTPRTERLEDLFVRQALAPSQGPGGALGPPKGSPGGEEGSS